MEIPQQLRDMAESLGVDVEQLVANIESGQHERPAQADPQAAAAAAIGGGLPAAGSAVQVQSPGAAEVPAQADDAAGVRTEAGETAEQRQARELAVVTQELQQTRSQLQAHTEGRVIGSGGLSGPVQQEPPTLAAIEPGLRFAVRNGLIPAEALREKFGDTIVELFLADQGGAI